MIVFVVTSPSVPIGPGFPMTMIPTTRKRQMLQTTDYKKLKVGVLTRRKFKYFIDAVYDGQKNVTDCHRFLCGCIDAILGDPTILANRSHFVDFTATYTDMGIGTLARINHNDMWIFMKPLDADLWLITATFAILTGFVVWAIESMDQGSQKTPSLHIGATFWFILMTLFFAQTSNGVTVGFHGGSFVGGRTVNNLHFEDYRHRPYYSYEDYAEALSKGGKHGGADAIIDEIPYIKMFLGLYSADYAMISSEPTTSGLGFIFQKGSPLATEMSTQIAKIREDGTLRILEKKWFEKQSSSSQDSPSKPKTLNLSRFRGLFLISGMSSALALMMSVIFLLRAKLEVHSIISFILNPNLVSNLRHLLYRNAIRI
ncbi:putative ionotropic glutamate receptor, metazoa [Helianthus annuus]|uniref:Ionotropic glutamate receptor, metazoa n=1 Tax=Helianthus annuus TaxID=4232 RepID=A0A251VN47_HELAN|nr:putative ionotropic glutamate receptor, metazoa [Helianthus annuus]KAJ0622606.1 putative solute-binding protein family 3/ domain of MltF [Helianthus annuus]KAJ0626855.1 putative solute-binding protein family 3/ domain of MltF [Helianthus annuus]